LQASEQDASSYMLERAGRRVDSLSMSLLKLTNRVAIGRLKDTLTKTAVGTMAEQEEDFSSLPLPDRFVHKVQSMSPRIPSALRRSEQPFVSID
jgi:hypothetical protein